MLEHAEALVRVRKSFAQLSSGGFTLESFETFLLQILNECEKRRQSSNQAINELKRQISVAEGQMHTWAQMSSLALDLMNAHIDRMRRSKEEEENRRKELEESGREEAPAPKKPRSKKTGKKE